MLRLPPCLGLSLALAVLPSRAGANSPPTVSNVVARQIPNTGQVEVTFDCADADGDLITARLICSSNNGAQFDLLPASVSGDVNRMMNAGPGKRIVWDAAADYPGRHWTQVIAKVYCSDGPATSGEMVLVPAGTFTMGSNAPDGNGSQSQPPHAVYLDAYYIDKYEVTNAEYQQFIEAGGYTTQAFWSAAGWAWRTASNVTQPNDWGEFGTTHPGFAVVGVSYYEAEAYASFAGKRLPTEAEWEKAARGTDQRSYPWGEALDPRRANYWNSEDPYSEGGTPVGFYDGRLHPSPPFQTLDSPSPFLAYDMTGNVSEWVRDWYGPYPSEAVSNPIGPLTGYLRITRGGCFETRIIQSYNPLSAYFRDTHMWGHSGQSIPTEPHRRDYRLGFRCARSAF